MSKCWWCDFEAMEGQLTCGLVSCSETEARTAMHMVRRETRTMGYSTRGQQKSGQKKGGKEELKGTELALRGEPEKVALERAVCGIENRHMRIRCGLSPEHGETHASGQLVWRGSERPRYADDRQLGELGPQAAPSDADRLATLTQVLLTVRSQMLGLATGFEEALRRNPKIIDRSVIQGLVVALSHIVRHLDSFKIAEGETEVRKNVRLGADELTASAFEMKRDLAKWVAGSDIPDHAPLCPTCGGTLSNIAGYAMGGTKVTGTLCLRCSGLLK